LKASFRLKLEKFLRLGGLSVGDFVFDTVMTDPDR
jgi:hypothetical protein